MVYFHHGKTNRVNRVKYVIHSLQNASAIQGSDPLREFVFLLHVGMYTPCAEENRTLDADPNFG
jgi:hypothetical protein